MNNSDDPDLWLTLAVRAARQLNMAVDLRERGNEAEAKVLMGCAEYNLGEARRLAWLPIDSEELAGSGDTT